MQRSRYNSYILCWVWFSQYQDSSVTLGNGDQYFMQKKKIFQKKNQKNQYFIQKISSVFVQQVLHMLACA